MAGSLRYDLTGQHLGQLLVLARDTSRTKDVYWLCQCLCGRVTSVCSSKLRDPERPTRSCGCLRVETRRRNGRARVHDLRGRTFGRLTVEARDEQRTKRVYWICRCSCGTLVSVRAGALTLKKSPTSSCGCLSREMGFRRNVKHGAAGLHRTPEYLAWKNMISRCSNPSDISYANYGGRGIMVCERWRASFVNFLADVGERPSPAHSLDRFPSNDGNYEPGNVRWATHSQQANNKRTTVCITWRDETHTLKEWSAIVPIPYSALQRRYRAGWSVERMLTQPLERHRRVS